MIRQLRSELLKLRTTRTAALLLLVAAGVTLLGASVEGLSRTAAKLAGEHDQRELFSAGITGVFFATLAGIIIVTNEFRYGTIRPTLLFEPRRRVVLAAKLAAAALAGTAFGIVCVALAFGAGLAILAMRDVDVTLTSAHTLALVLGAIAASTLGGLLGVAIGTLIRDQVGAIVALACYAIAVDAGLFAAMPQAGRYLPGKAGDALGGRAVDDLLTPGAGAVVLVAWTLVFIVAATVRNDRSDV